MSPRARMRIGVPVVAAWLAMVVGTIVLAGWALDVAALRTVLPGAVPMMPNTAVALMLAGAALQWAGRPGGRVAVAGVLVIAVATLSEYVVGWNLHVDQLLYRDAVSPFRAPGRMAITTAIGLLVLGTALALAWRRAPGRRRGAEVLAGVVGLFALFEIEGYIVGAEAPGGYTKMALHTALVLLGLSIGTIVAVPDGWLVARARDPGPGGILTRRLLPIAIGLPLALGALGTLGEAAGWLDDRSSIGFMVTLTILLLFVAGVWSVATVDRVERDRKAAATALRESERQLAAAQATAHVGSWELDVATNQVTWSDEAYRLFGVPIGSPVSYAVYLGCVHPEDRARVERLVGQSLAAGREVQYEYRVLRPDGVVRYVLGRNVVTKDDAGQPVRFAGSLLDLTDRKAMEDALRVALLEVKTLRGYLRVCANCKRVQGQDDVWEQLESYVRRHSEAEFSHGICPDCAATWAATPI